MNFLKSEKNVYEFYKKIVKTLYGSADIYKIQKTSKQVVIKTSILNAIAEDSFEDPCNEQKLLEYLADQPNYPEQLIQLVDCFTTKEKDRICHHLVTNQINGIELFSLVEEKKEEYWSEKNIKNIFNQLLDAVEFLHAHSIAHLDISAENILIDPKTMRTTLIDLGLALKVGNGRVTGWNKISRFKRGKAYYTCPEISALEFSFDAYKADIFSLGVVLFVLWTGKPLFKGATFNDVFYSCYCNVPIKEYVRLVYPKEAANIPDDVLELIQCMTTHEEEKRISLKQVRSHKWLN